MQTKAKNYHFGTRLRATTQELAIHYLELHSPKPPFCFYAASKDAIKCRSRRRRSVPARMRKVETCLHFACLLMMRNSMCPFRRVKIRPRAAQLIAQKEMLCEPASYWILQSNSLINRNEKIPVILWYIRTIIPCIAVFKLKHGIVLMPYKPPKDSTKSPFKPRSNRLMDQVREVLRYNHYAIRTV